MEQTKVQQHYPELSHYTKGATSKLSNFACLDYKPRPRGVAGKRMGKEGEGDGWIEESRQEGAQGGGLARVEYVSRTEYPNTRQRWGDGEEDG